jgi:hypothetical protein
MSDLIQMVGWVCEGRRFVGIELTEHYYELAEQRIRGVAVHDAKAGQGALDLDGEAVA